MAMGVNELGLAVVGLLLFIYYLTLNNNYWRSRGIKGPKPIPLFGTTKDLMLNKCGMGDYLHSVYKEWKKEPLIGVFVLRRPDLVVNDLGLVKDVLIKDFSKFADRGEKVNEKIERLSAHLFSIESTRWRPLRTKLSPVFTSGKLKKMFYLLIECADHLDKYLTVKINDPNGEGATIDCNEITSKFTTDVIGVCAFGLRINAIADKECRFLTMGRKIFKLGWKKFVNFRLKHLAPTVYDVIGSFFVDKELEDFFIGTILQTMEYRKRTGLVRHDFVDLLLKIKDHPDKMSDIELTDQLLAAQFFVFFAAGFETSSTTMSNALFELAQNHQIQHKLRKEIKDEMDRTGGVLEYEGIKNLKYLDMVFQETLRLYPPANFLVRKSTEPYTFQTASGSNVLSIDRGQIVWIPIYAIQRDPLYFPNPDIFDPERFTPEAIKSRVPMSYLPFGDGPRNCIGKRFAVMQTKVGLVKMLYRYKVDVCEKTQIPYVNNPKTFLLTPKYGIHLKIIRDTSCDTAGNGPSNENI